MGTKRTDELRAGAMRIALTSGPTRKQVASDLGVGLSSLNKRVSAHRDTDVVSDGGLVSAMSMGTGTSATAQSVDADGCWNASGHRCMEAINTYHDGSQSMSVRFRNTCGRGVHILPHKSPRGRLYGPLIRI